MIRFATLTLAALVSAVSFAQLTAGIETNVVYESQIITNNAWMKHLVTELIENGKAPELKDRAKAFVSAANLAAMKVAVEDSKRVYDAWIRGFEQGCEELRSKIGQSPTSGMFLKLMFPYVPDSTRKTVDIFVVSNHYDTVKNRDVMWIYCNRELPMEPIVEIPYVYESGFTTNRVVGTFEPKDVAKAHWTNTVTISRFGYEYKNCHVLYANRPANLANYPCRLNRNGLWGKTGGGFDWGMIGVTVEGVPTLTAELTNTVQNKVVVFSNGGFTGIIDLNNTEASE